MDLLELKIYMRYGKHLADMTMTGLLGEPPKHIRSSKLHGGLRLSYTYKLNLYYGIYVQYFVGYGDYLLNTTDSVIAWVSDLGL